MPVSEHRRRWHAALSAGVRAELLLHQGELEAALREMGDPQVWVNYQDILGSPFFSLSYERYVRAETLAGLGRLEEAIRQFSSFGELSYWDLVFQAPSHFRRAELYEELGRDGEAAEQYRRFLALWRQPDPDLRSWVERAEARLSTLSAAASG